MFESFNEEINIIKYKKIKKIFSELFTFNN
jgi:hypothetical protein